MSDIEKRNSHQEENKILSEINEEKNISFEEELPSKKEQAKPRTGGGVWESVTKWSIYLLIFLTPLFFLPWGISPVVQNKQFLATVLVGIALIAWLAKTIVSGRIVYRKSPLNIAMWILALSWGISTYFSISRTRSFGFLGVDPDVFLNILNYVMAFFLVTNTFNGQKVGQPDKTLSKFLKEKDSGIKGAVYCLLLSVAILSIFIALKFLKINFLPVSWQFAQSIEFNPIGTINGMALFLSFGFVIIISILTNSEKILAIEENVNSSIIRKRKIIKSSLIVLATVLAIELLIINFKFVWWALGSAMLLLTAFGFVKEAQEIKAGKRKVLSIENLAIPLFVLTASVVLILVNLIVVNWPFSKFVSFSLEVTPSVSSTYEIAKNVLKSEGIKSNLLGSGPATFTFDYGLHRSSLDPRNPIENFFWGVRFSHGFNFILTTLTSEGILGVFALFFLLFTFVWQLLGGFLPSKLSLKILTNRRKADSSVSSSAIIDSEKDSSLFSFVSRNEEIADLNITFACASLFMLIIWFLYPLNFTLLMFNFIALGLLVASNGTAQKLLSPSYFNSDQTEVIESVVEPSKKLREISLLTSPQRTLIISLLLIILMVGVVSLVYLESQKYIASLYFSSAVNTFNRTNDPQATLDQITKAINLDPSNDAYWRAGSQAFLLKANQILNSPQWQGATATVTEDLRSQFQLNVSQAISFAQRATYEIDRESLNWTNLGYVYENILPFVTGGEKFLIDSYQKAISLEPTNPALQADLGRAHLVIADKLQTQINQLAAVEKSDRAQIDALTQQKNQELELALEELEKALNLKPDYSPSHFLMTQVYTRQGDIKKAISRSQDYYNLNQNDPGAAFQLGFLLYKDNQLEASKAVLQKAVELKEDYSNAKYFLGLIYDQEGNKEMAKKEFERIAELNPDNVELKKILENLNNNKPALDGIVPPAPPPTERTETPVAETGGALSQPFQP